MSFGIFQLIVSILEGGVVPVMLEKMAQSSVVCQFVCLDLKYIETLMCCSVHIANALDGCICLSPL